MKDRLIELILNTPVLKFPSGSRAQGKTYQTAQNVADHLLENGVIVPPMKLGQTCFEPCNYRNTIDECRVSSITQKVDGTFKIRLTNLRGKWVFEITADNIGTTLFLTKEEAEKALAERSKE